jgi:two-component system chemotaxis response regulator CheB
MSELEHRPADDGVTRVLLVDDSPTARRALRAVLEQDGLCRVVGEAQDSASALRLVQSTKPDVVTMDVFLGQDDGVATAAAIMAQRPLPILIITGADAKSPDLIFRAMAAGALHVEPKPPSRRDPAFERYQRRLVRLVRSLSQVPVVRRRPTSQPAINSSGANATALMSRRARPRLVLLGASTGGPPELLRILRAFPAPLAVPVVIVQHVAEGFGRGLAQWLAESSGHRACVCEHGCAVGPGTVYFPADGRHLRLRTAFALEPHDGPPRNFQRPAIDELFESAALVAGPDVVAALLTGMGEDGAAGLVALRQAGALTLAQSPETCVVGSMPSAAIGRGGVDFALAPSELAAALRALVAPDPKAVG